MYQLVEDVLLKYQPENVITHLAIALESSHTSIRYWNAQIAGSFPSVNLLNPLFNNIEKGDFDMRYACNSPLEQIKDKQVKIFLEEWLKKEEEEIRELILEIL